MPIRNIPRLLFAALVVLASPVRAAEEPKLSDVRTIAIIVAMGDSAEYQAVDLSGYSNEKGTIDISNWGLDNLAGQDIAAALKGLYTIVPAAYDHAAYAAPNDVAFGNSALFRLIAARPDRAQIDAYVVLVPITTGDPISPAPGSSLGGVLSAVMPGQMLRGLGLYRHPQGNHHLVADYALYDMAVIDSRTCNIIVDNKLILGNTRFLNQVLSWKRTTEDMMPATLVEMTDAQRQAFRARATTLIEASIKPTLAQIGLVPGGPMPVSKDIHIPVWPVRQ